LDAVLWSVHLTVAVSGIASPNYQQCSALMFKAVL